jgi:hypothetical protein
MNAKDLKNTPGPWEIVYRDDNPFQKMALIYKKDAIENVINNFDLNENKSNTKVIAVIWHQRNSIENKDAISGDESDANDRLIAAAPEWQHWNDYFADALELIPGINVDREIMTAKRLPVTQRKKAIKKILDDRKEGQP